MSVFLWEGPNYRFDCLPNIVACSYGK